MFFIVGVSGEERQLDYLQQVECKCCGEKGHLEILEEYNTLKLFGLQTVRWNHKYYAAMSCCHARCEIKKEVGERIERGLRVYLNPSEMRFVGGRHRTCPYCGFPIEPNFDYCPRCSRKI